MNKTGVITKVIDGKNVTFRFGMNCWDLFCTLKQCKIGEIGNLLDEQNPGMIGHMRDLIYCAAASHCYIMMLPLDFNQWTVGEWLDEMPQQDYQDIITCMTNSKLLGKELGQASKVLEAAAAVSPKTEI